ncbi:MAG: acylphosphatase [Oscillospiraceae bacterium]|nr:acylphosphatase [Oscillospiraceae bacterium]
MEDKSVRWRVLFSGQVQRVGFRYTAYYLARDLGLSGWAKNLDDGRVEMEIQGRPSQIRKLLLRLKAQPQLKIAGMEIQSVPVRPFERRFRVLGSST